MKKKRKRNIKREIGASLVLIIAFGCFCFFIAQNRTGNIQKSTAPKPTNTVRVTNTPRPTFTPTPIDTPTLIDTPIPKKKIN